MFWQPNTAPCRLLSPHPSRACRRPEPSLDAHFEGPGHGPSRSGGHGRSSKSHSAIVGRGGSLVAEAYTSAPCKAALSLNSLVESHLASKNVHQTSGAILTTGSLHLAALGRGRTGPAPGKRYHCRSQAGPQQYASIARAIVYPLDMPGVCLDTGRPLLTF